MGMFDNVLCDMDLPGDPAPSRRTYFQTKDLQEHPQMDLFGITHEGVLLALSSYQRKLGERFIFTGDVDLIEIDRAYACWEYRLRFDHGQCVNVELVRYDPPGTHAPPGWVQNDRGQWAPPKQRP